MYLQSAFVFDLLRDFGSGLKPNFVAVEHQIGLELLFQSRLNLIVKTSIVACVSGISIRSFVLGAGSFTMSHNHLPERPSTGRVVCTIRELTFRTS